eukprot:s1707_g5.t1
MLRFAEVLPKMLKLPEGSELPASRIRFFWMEADVNRDKNIAFTEFLSWWLKHLTNETNMSDFLHIQNPEIMDPRHFMAMATFRSSYT